MPPTGAASSPKARAKRSPRMCFLTRTRMAKTRIRNITRRTTRMTAVSSGQTSGETAGAHAGELLTLAASHSGRTLLLERCFGTPLPTRVPNVRSLVDPQLAGAAVVLSSPPLGFLNPITSTSASVRAMHRPPHRSAWTRTTARSTPETWAAQSSRMAQKDGARHHAPRPPADSRIQEGRTGRCRPRMRRRWTRSWRPRRTMMTTSRPA